MAMTLTQSVVITHISSFLDIFDLSSLDGTSHEVSNGGSDGKQQPLGWLSAAERVGLSLRGAGKSSIKAALCAVRNLGFCPPQPISIHSKQCVQELTKLAKRLTKETKTREAADETLKRMLENHAHPLPLDEIASTAQGAAESAVAGASAALDAAAARMAALPAQVMSAAELAAAASVSELQSEIEVATAENRTAFEAHIEQEIKMLTDVQFAARNVITADISSVRAELQSIKNSNS